MFDQSIDPKDILVHQIKEIVAEIPFGHVAAVEEIAEALELPPEKEDEVAWALREINDDTIPTWRVVRDDGTLPENNAQGDWEDQKTILENENITFTEDNKVDITKHLWSACEYVRS